MQHRYFSVLYRQPGVAAAFQVATAPGANDQSTGKVMVLGTSTGGLSIDQTAALRALTGHPCYWFTNAEQAKAILRSGNGLRLIEKAFNPSPNLPGAQKCGFMRISDGVQASLTLQDAAYDALLLTCRDAGAWGSQIRVQVETGTGSVGKKITVQYASETAQVGDVLTRPMLAVICEDSAASAATITINPIVTGGGAGTITTTVTGGTAANLSIDLAAYPTIQSVCDYINLQNLYKATILSGHGSDPSIWLDAATAQSIWLCTTMDGSAAAGTTVVPCTATSGMTVGDYVYLEDDATPANNEIVRVGSIDTGVSFTLDATYSPTGLLYDYTSGAKVAADGTPLVGDLYACYRWINDTVDEISATRVTTANAGKAPPKNITYKYLSGGADGTATLPRLVEALGYLADEEVNFILIESETAAWHAAVAAHCADATILNPNRYGIVGGAVAENEAQRHTRAFNLNTDKMTLVAEGHYDYTVDGSGDTELLSPMYSAALVAGLCAGLEVQDPTTRKAIKCLGLENNYASSSRDDMINAGCVCFRLIPGQGYVVVQGVTSLQSNLGLWDRTTNMSAELSMARVRDQFIYEFNVDADKLVVGANPRRLTKADVETLAEAHCTRAVKNGWFRAVPATDTQPELPAYDPIIVYKEDDAWYVQIAGRWNGPNNFCFLLLKVVS